MAGIRRFEVGCGAAAVVPANAGTRAPRPLLLNKITNTSRNQLPPVVMGPCVRRDDGRVSDSIFKEPTHVHDLAARCARGLLEVLALERQRAQGRPGACCTRGLACDLRITICTRAYRAAGASRPSLRNGFTVE